MEEMEPHSKLSAPALRVCDLRPATLRPATLRRRDGSQAAFHLAAAAQGRPFLRVLSPFDVPGCHQQGPIPVNLADLHRDL